MDMRYSGATRVTRFLALAVMVSALAACGIPRPGPTKSEILELQDDQTAETSIVIVNESVTRAVAIPPEPGFPSKLTKAGIVTSERIRPGDTLSVSIYENVDDGVLNRGNAAFSTLDALQVDEAGFIFIPYAGRIRASGNTTERLRQIITEKLSGLTPEPQVLVRRAAGDDATVSVLGNGIASQGVYPLQRSSRRLMEMLATAGGISAPPEVARVIVLRNHIKGEIWFEDIYDNPQYDIALRSGDRVVVERDPRIFTVLGATGRQANVPFGKRDLSALEAVAQVGGLDSRTANPTGFFIIRKHGPKLANALTGRTDLTREQSIIFVINLTEPNGFPLARDFDIRDGDTIYVTEAPFVQWTKTLNAITGTAQTVNTLENVGTTN